jgi:hypothetical protein
MKQNKMKLVPLATKLKLAGVGFLIALLVFFVVLGLVGIGVLAVDVFGFFWIWAISASVLLKIGMRRKIKSENALTIQALVEEIQYGKSEKEKTGREVLRTEIYPRIIDFSKYLEEKGHNKNIAIIGMAGSGKTELTYYIISQMKQYHKVIFQYKNSDRYRELGYPVLFLKNYSPNVFKDKEAFTQAWVTAFAVENRGIMASQITPLVRTAVGKSNNWQEFKAEIDKQMKETEGTLTGSVYTDIRLKMDSVYSDKQYDIEIPEDIVVDFEGLNKDAFVFYAEYLLRELYEEVKAGTRTGTMIFVDEAHVFTRTNNTIIPELSAIIRSRGAFLFATQRASTIAGDIKGNAGTQFCFKQTERDDLNQVSALSEPYHWIVQRLKPYEFVDLAQSESHLGVFCFQLENPKPDFKPVVEWKPEGKHEENKSQDGKSEGSSVEDIPNEVRKLLDSPANQQDLAKRFVKEYGREVNYWKMTLKASLKKMHQQGDIGATLTDYVKWNNDKSYPILDSLVYHRTGDYSYHDWLVGITADILYQMGLIPQVQAHGLPLADILVEKPKLAFEIETGSKNGYKIEETKERIADFEKQGYKVYVIVPNQEVKQKYKDFENVYTALEYWEDTSHLQSETKRAEKKMMEVRKENE